MPTSNSCAFTIKPSSRILQAYMAKVQNNSTRNGDVTNKPQRQNSRILLSALNSIRRDSENPSPEILYQVLKHVVPLREGCMSYLPNANFIKSTQHFYAALTRTVTQFCMHMIAVSLYLRICGFFLGCGGGLPGFFV